MATSISIAQRKKNRAVIDGCLFREKINIHYSLGGNDNIVDVRFFKRDEDAIIIQHDDERLERVNVDDIYTIEKMS